jgi:hypothetical protein
MSRVVQYMGATSIIATAPASTVVDVEASPAGAFSGNVILGRVPAGTFTGNVLQLTEGTNSLMQVRSVSFSMVFVLAPARSHVV